MKKLILVFAIFLITVTVAQPQSLKDISSNEKIINTDTSDYVFSFRLKPVYTSVQNSTGSTYHDNGFGFTFSLQYDFGKLVSMFFDVNTSSFRYHEIKFNEQGLPFHIDKGYQTSNMILLGTKFYPMRPQYPVYLKVGIGLLLEKMIPPVLNFGIGYEYKLSKTFNLFIEGEADHYSGFMEAPAGTYLSVGIGTSIYIGNLYGKW